VFTFGPDDVSDEVPAAQQDAGNSVPQQIDVTNEGLKALVDEAQTDYEKGYHCEANEETFHDL